MMTVRVLEPLRHDGVDVAPGELLALSEAAAAPLLALGAVAAAPKLSAARATKRGAVPHEEAP
jgi:hypothetical protein